MFFFINIIKNPWFAIRFLGSIGSRNSESTSKRIAEIEVLCKDHSLFIEIRHLFHGF